MTRSQVDPAPAILVGRYLEQNPPQGFRDRFSAYTWATIVTIVRHADRVVTGAIRADDDAR